MDLRLKRLTLWLTTAALAAAAAGAVAYTVLVPIDLPQIASTARGDTARPAATAPAVDFQAFEDLDLRRPIADPVTTLPAASALAAFAPPLPVRLVTGTVIEPGHSYAVLSMTNGKTVLGKVGDRLSGAEVVAVNDGSVTLSYFGRTVTLHAPVPMRKAIPQ
jgi:hypothetical protein